MLANWQGMRDREGPAYERYAIGHAAAAARMLAQLPPGDDPGE